jgi:hypothetical protein
VGVTVAVTGCVGCGEDVGPTGAVDVDPEVGGSDTVTSSVWVAVGRSVWVGKGTGVRVALGVQVDEGVGMIVGGKI